MVETAQTEESQPKATAPEQLTINKRYILFVGNLAFDTTVDQIRKHFHAAEPIKSVRLMTDKATKKPKGFAFVEFDDLEAFSKGLTYHHTMFKKRQINVEMTAGGGGNTVKRRQKLKAKNEMLEKNRQKQVDGKPTNAKKPKTFLLPPKMTSSNMVPVKVKKNKPASKQQ